MAVDKTKAVPPGLDVSKPNVARMYDHMLGGKDNYAVDRAQVEKAVSADPAVPMLIRENRAFVGRTVRFLAAEAGIDQFLDIGSGLPTQRNVHEIALPINPGARVVYVDYDPVVVTHGRALLAREDQVIAMRGDIREPGGILSAPEVTALLDLSRPLALVCTATLHFVPDENDPAAIMARLRAALAPGSYLALTHASDDERREAVGRVAKVYQQTSAPGTPRTREQVLEYFGDFELVEPGLVWVPSWRPDHEISPDEAKLAWFYAGVGRKP